ncbi:MAG: RNA methyltransferase [Acidobacteriota bacterium]|nr:RNA methyltransferase [Acidobacteriota bacterium]
MLKITSRENQRLKQARRVRDGVEKDLIFVEGLRLAEEVLRSGLEIEEIFIGKNFAKNEREKKFLENSARDSVSIFEVSENVFDSLADTKNSQGIVLIARKPDAGRHKIGTALQKKGRIPLVLLLHKINNPANLGAILRTAEAVGIVGVILTKDSADVFSPKSLRGAMGAAFRLPLWTGADFFDVLSWSRTNGLISVAADIRAEKSYLEIDWRTPKILIFGSEAHGLSKVERTDIDETLKIPMENNVESLNLAVSAGVILFEAKRQIELFQKTAS